MHPTDYRFQEGALLQVVSEFLSMFDGSLDQVLISRESGTHGFRRQGQYTGRVEHLCRNKECSPPYHCLWAKGLQGLVPDKDSPLSSGPELAYGRTRGGTRLRRIPHKSPQVRALVSSLRKHCQHLPVEVMPDCRRGHRVVWCRVSERNT